MSLAVVNIGQLLTLAGPARPRIGPELRELGMIRDATLLIDGARIRAIGTMNEIAPSITPDTEVIDANSRVVSPGFVDAHTHPVFAGTRVDELELRSAGASYQQIAAAGGGIRSTVRRTRDATEDQLLASASRYAHWFVRNGTTTIEAKSGYGLTLEDELKMLRVIRRFGEISRLRCVPTFLGAHEIPDEYRGRSGEYVDLVTHEMLPRVAESRLAEFCDVFCEPGIFDLDSTRKILRRAGQLGLSARIHADQLTRSGGAQLAAEVGAKTADHLEQIDAAGIAALLAAGVQPVLLPASVFGLGLSAYPNARAMIDAGLAVVLATDFNPGSSPTTSMPMVLSLACRYLKMTPAESITAATINAAYSLNRGETIGSLEPGKQADFVLWNGEDYREIPYFFGTDQAAKVYISGECAFTGPGSRP
ncbi:MAG: imidazolonepropionase [Bryobacteraceae bacterium]|jgi:imidazolonepropionase